jgi:hypothetical protein
MGEARFGKGGSELMETGVPHRQPAQPSRKAKAGRCQARGSRTNSQVQVQTVFSKITGPLVTQLPVHNNSFRRAE